MAAWLALIVVLQVPVEGEPAPCCFEAPPPGWSDLDGLAERVDAERSTDPATGRETLRGHGTTVVIAPGLSVMLVNGVPRPLSAPVEVRAGRILVPAEVAGAFGESHATAPAARRPAPTIPPVARRPGRGLRVVIDPGHGGMHTGGKSRGGLMEKDVVLDVSKRLRALLEQDGVDVVMTRTDDRHFANDVHEDLQERVEIANRARPDLFLSVHSNYHPTPDPRGFEVYVARHLDRSRAAGRTVAMEILRQFRANLESEDRGLKEAGFFVLRHVQAPAVLVELEFISNPRGERELGSPGQRQKYATLLAEAVRKSLSKR